MHYEISQHQPSPPEVGAAGGQHTFMGLHVCRPDLQHHVTERQVMSQRVHTMHC